MNFPIFSEQFSFSIDNISSNTPNRWAVTFFCTECGVKISEGKLHDLELHQSVDLV